LAYESQQQTARHRGLEQARKIRMRLGGGVDLLAPFPARPKGMHRHTFQRLRARALAVGDVENPGFPGLDRVNDRGGLADDRENAVASPPKKVEVTPQKP